VPTVSRGSKGVFAVAPYEADAEGVLRPRLPARCPFATGAESCRLGVDHLRDRKSGPRFPLAVVGCSRHRQHRFTLYPPGHVRYGRVAVAPYDPSGKLVYNEGTHEPAWQETLFAAALDAAAGERWPADSPAQDSRRRRTQGRRLERAAWLLGVHPELDLLTRERIATRLQVATMTLLEGARSWGASWTAQGSAVLSVLLALSPPLALLDRLLAGGALTGLWPEPSVESPSPSRSARSERFAAGAHRPRGPPPTNLPDSLGEKPL
jgi:hypothetical protein